MIEIIKDEWYFTKDEFQFILIRKYKKRKGVWGKTDEWLDEWIEKQEQVGFFVSLKAMLTAMAHILVKEKCDAGQIKTIHEYISALEEVEEKLIDATRGY